ncbi:hypothetical protein PGT21_029613 [Puccinia graminis f. sp. tritici]|uniref:mRNA stability protein n=2 Tax=Puccinia graminis f. sp. tritici TaxID=56615 RepID=E3KRH0_PUCGT|nr:uncharacterized protein PGTG_12636 [Puccinia graminis f. sp. tritici CRL 75-36-700-3]KAA1098188.1 hypothetical protein PGT21_030080 [Puccinia graminis f. sp. tritici]EFP86895.2 hypothetical protein PGTG_12636 [Puccinia graminis f. sp. tritici CRL 75-36-700-3]KAA1101770.1 hypothetical protein PGT21_029613 [Puccinia graminis f. sp. tritici]KAA1116846.1 hypothetical protein PGTUg99_026423 [Puccinia graminis f. sp. tritici]KAA1136213.1 hypothetical protein PGTUg99_003765 [Puccinia graminis f. s
MALNPHQRKKVDINAMTEEEQKLFRLYGKLPPKKNVAKHNLMERKYFDSGDYALSKAGKTAPQSVGTTIPSPENIHHASHTSTPTPTGQHPSMTHLNSESNSANPGVLPKHGTDGPILEAIDNAIVTDGNAHPSTEQAIEPSQPVNLQ